MIRGVLADVREAIADTCAMIVARPALVALFAAAQVASNLLRLWLGSIDDGGASPFLWAAGGLFLFVRICLTLWLHVAAARLSVDAAVPVRAAFAIDRAQATWFHGMVVVSIVAFVLRLWLGRFSGGFFAPIGMAGGRALAGMASGLFVTYLIFLPFQPGWFALLTGRGEPSLRWSFAAIRGQFARALAAVMLLVLPPAVVRLAVFDMLARGGWWVVAIALLDAALTILLMLLATCVYRQTWRRGLARGSLGAGTALRT